MSVLDVLRCGPATTLQDAGRRGVMAYGVSRGGAADLLALAEGQALLNQSGAALELVGMGGSFVAQDTRRIALTGAPMRADLDGVALAWNASHLMPAGARLTIQGALEGSYGYLHLGGGFAEAEILGSRSTHLAAGLGQVVQAGDRLALGVDAEPEDVGLVLTPTDRFGGGEVRVVPSLQTALFAQAEIARFEATAFQRDQRGNRMGARLTYEGAGFASESGLSVLSEAVLPGDIQITGDGTPFVLLGECQTTGGYPRIGAVLPCDVPRVVQARPGQALRFRFLNLEEGVAVERAARLAQTKLRAQTRPLIRDPRDMGDLLAYQLISGVTAGDHMEEP